MSRGVFIFACHDANLNTSLNPSFARREKHVSSFPATAGSRLHYYQIKKVRRDMLQGFSLLIMRGNGMLSLTCERPQIQVTSRSRP